ncbi:hypothetical protein G3M48_002947, partial [Beauveria asiatica]
MTAELAASIASSLTQPILLTAAFAADLGEYTREIHHGFAAFVSGDWEAGLRIIDDVDGLQPAEQVATKPDDVFVSGRGDDELELRLIKM